MPPEKEEGKEHSNDTSTSNKGGGGAEEESKTLTEKDVQRERDKAVTQALKTRDADWEKKLSDSSKDAEAKLAEIRQELETQKTQREQAEAKAVFVSEAIQKGVVDPDGAMVIAQSGGYTRDGRTDWDKLKTDKPYLFKAENTRNPKSYAGKKSSDTDDDGMEQLIRRGFKGG